MIGTAAVILGIGMVKRPGDTAVAPTWPYGPSGDIDRDDKPFGVAEIAGMRAFGRIDGARTRP